MDNDASEVYLWEGAALFVGMLRDVDRHRHHAVQICLALEDPFEIYVEGRWHRSKLAIIPGNIPHQLRASTSKLVVLLAYGSPQLARKISLLGPQFNSTVPAKLARAPKSLIEAKHYQNAVNSELFDEIEPRADQQGADSRIASSLEYIDRNIEEPLTTAILAKQIGLSESRFIHLFTENAGLPMRRYILWRRVIRTVDAILSGSSLTMAAHQAGFADSAHFSRTFRQTFGLSPSEIFARSRNVQVFT